MYDCIQLNELGTFNHILNISFGYAHEYSPFPDLVGQIVETIPGILYGALLLKQTLNMMLF